MRERVYQVPQEQFVRAWNASPTLAEAASQVAALVGKPVPRWAVFARAGELRDAGVEMRKLLPPAPRVAA